MTLDYGNYGIFLITGDVGFIINRMLGSLGLGSFWALQCNPTWAINPDP